MSKGRILFCNVFPQAPAAARADLCITVRCMVLIAVDRAFGAASVGNEDEVILGENDAFLDAVYFALDGFCYFLSIVDFKDNVGYFGIELEVYAGILEVFLHRKNQGFILVVLREFQCGEVRQSADVVNEPLEVQLHLQCTVPVFKCEHRSPVQPEGGIEDFIIENILDRLVVQILVSCHEEFHDLHAAFLAQVELAVGMGILAAVLRCTAQGVVRVFFVQPVILIKNGYTRCLN